MNSSKFPAIKSGTTIGVLLGTTVVTIGIIRYASGMILKGNQSLSYVYWCIFTIAVFLAVFRFNKKHPELFTLKQTVKIGLFAGLISGLMYTVYIVILNNFIDTELSSKLINLNIREHISSNPGMPANEINRLSNPMKMSSSLRGLTYTLVCMAFGIIHSLLGTILVKKLNKNS